MVHNERKEEANEKHQYDLIINIIYYESGARGDIYVILYLPSYCNYSTIRTPQVLVPPICANNSRAYKTIIA